MFIFVLILILIAVSLLWDYLIRRKRKHFLKKYQIKGLWSLPFIGNAIQFANVTAESSFYANIKLLQASVNKKFCVWMMHKLVIFNADPEELQVLLSSPIHTTKSLLADVTEPWLGTGVLTSKTYKWHARRKLITPTLHFSILNKFLQTFDRCSTELMEQWKHKADGVTAFDMVPSLGVSGFDMFMETSMGVKQNSLQNINSRYVNAQTFASDILSDRLRRPLWSVDWIFRLLCPLLYSKLQDSIKIMRKFAHEIIALRSAELQQELKENAKLNQQYEPDQEFACKTRVPLMDALLLSRTADGKPLSDNDILEEVETFIFAGFDTSKTTISHALYLISRHPQVQQKLFEEICTVFGKDKYKPASYAELQNLSYMELVIKETLRLYPTVPIIGRYFEHETELNGKIIPANTHYAIAIYALHRDPEYFEQPDKFIPERFIDPKFKLFTYIPFSAGPRNCIGQRFIQLQMRSTLSKVLRHYELLPLGPDMEPSLSLVLRSKSGAHVGLKPRVYN